MSLSGREYAYQLIDRIASQYDVLSEEAMCLKMIGSEALKKMDATIIPYTELFAEYPALLNHDLFKMLEDEHEEVEAWRKKEKSELDDLKKKFLPTIMKLNQSRIMDDIELKKDERERYFRSFSNSSCKLYLDIKSFPHKKLGEAERIRVFWEVWRALPSIYLFIFDVCLVTGCLRSGRPMQPRRTFEEYCDLYCTVFEDLLKTDIESDSEYESILSLMRIMLTLIAFCFTGIDQEM
jgi:hypothetical protein